MHSRSGIVDSTSYSASQSSSMRVGWDTAVDDGADASSTMAATVVVVFVVVIVLILVSTDAFDDLTTADHDDRAACAGEGTGVSASPDNVVVHVVVFPSSFSSSTTISPPHPVEDVAVARPRDDQASTSLYSTEEDDGRDGGGGIGGS